MAEESVNPIDINYVQGEDGVTEAHVKATNEEDFDDRRNNIAEQVFVELDICIKAYQEGFGEDNGFSILEFCHSNFAMILDIHPNDHVLYNVKIDDFDIPNSKFVNEEGETVYKIYNLKDEEKLAYICNLLHNANLGIQELAKSGYFNGIDSNNTLYVDIDRTLTILTLKLDEAILFTNTILNKLYK